MKRPAALAAIAAVAAAAVWFAIRSYQQDFAAYWTAALARSAGLDPYVNYAGAGGALAPWDGVALFRHSRFLYPPLVADLFRPLLVLPYLAAKALFTVAMLAAWIAAGLVVTDDRPGRTVFFVAGALFFPLYRHLERGQIDLLILLLLALAWRARRQPVAAGAALALAGAIKPAFLGLLPIVWALGRGRTVLAALAVAAGVLGMTALVDGPARLRAYVTQVLPRAALYGEGGTEEMLLPAERLPAQDVQDDGEEIRVQRRTYRMSIGDAPAAASLPRLLAPEGPTPATARLPFFVAIAGLTALAARQRRRADPPVAALIFWATAVACVVTSPAGWVMGLVVALPLVTLGATLLVAGRLDRRLAAAGALAWAAAALPAPFSGFPALAGVALIGLAVAAVLTDPATGRPA